MTRKRLLAMFLTFAMVAVLVAGCGSVASDSQGGGSANAGALSDVAWDTNVKDEIVVSVINGYYTAGEKLLAEEYTALHPETTVTIDVIADNDSYSAKMQTIISAEDTENTPDIVHANFLISVLGSESTAFEKGYLLDLSDVLDMEHPYQDGLVRDMFTETVITEGYNAFDGVHLGALPFDKCGISFYYNKDAFAELGLSAPESWEELLEVCETFRESGIENPITVTSEASWILASLADAGFRYQEYDYLIQPGDALWDEESMSANIDFEFDDSNLACDIFTVYSTERLLAARKDGIIFSDISKTAWSEFAKIAQYFPENFISSGADAVTEFEMQISPMVLSGSWNVGLIIDDLKQLSEDQQFDWATFNVPGFENPPEGFGSEMRGLYGLGNVMGIVPTGNEDHDARVLDFYLYWYSQDGAQRCYEETLTNGNYVQGPCMIAGVVLSDELNEKLEGFIVEGPLKNWASELIGMTYTTEADRYIHNDLINQLQAGTIDIDSFLEQMSVVLNDKADSDIENGGYDLDPTTPDSAG